MTKKQIGKRFLQILIVLFGISFLTFGLTYLSPGDPAEIMLTECGNLPTPELLEQTRHDLALIRSFAHQIAVMYLGNIVEVIPGEDVTEHAVHPSIYTGTSGCTVLHSYGSQPEDPKYRE